MIRYPLRMWSITAHRSGDWGRSLLLALCIVAPATLANQIIPAGGTVLVSGGVFNLGCNDVAVNGLLDLGTGKYVNVRNVIVGPTGIIQRGSIRYSGTLTVDGTIDPSVELIANSPLDLACPGAVAAVTPIPALGRSMLVALALLLLVPALRALRGRAAPRRRSEANGAKR